MELRCCVESIENKVIVEGRKVILSRKSLEKNCQNKREIFRKFPMSILGKPEKY